MLDFRWFLSSIMTFGGGADLIGRGKFMGFKDSKIKKYTDINYITI